MNRPRPEMEPYAEIPTLEEGLEMGSDDWADLTVAATSEFEEPEMDPEEALGFWADWLVQRAVHHYDAVVAFTGTEGKGKSTLAMRLARLCTERAFRAKLVARSRWDPVAPWLCYSARDLLEAYRLAGPGHVILYDEGVRGLFAGEQMTPEQRAIVKALALVRETNALLFICSPDIWMVAKQVRGRRAALWMHVVRRGLARVHERDERLRYLPHDDLGLTISPRAPHVAWAPFAQNSALWRTYLATKKAKLGEFLDEAIADLEGRRQGRKGGRLTRRELSALHRKGWAERHAAELRGDPPASA
jgi:predicted kinase